MEKMKQLFSISLLLVTMMGIASFPAIADNEYVPRSQKNVLYQAPITGIGIEGKEVTITHFGISAGFVGDKHMHPGPIFVYVLEGELTVESEGETKTFKTGAIYAKDAGQAVTGMNLSLSDDLEILVFQIGDIGKPTMIKVE